MKAPHKAPRKKLLALLVLLACAAVLLALRTSEPRYNGQRLTYWLRQYSDTSHFETNRWTDARDAIRGIGAERSLPILLKLITAKDSAFSKWAMKASERLNLRFHHWHTETECHVNGLAGFEVLGSNAAPAIDALTKLLDDKDNALMATRCLQHIGKPAEHALCQCLTNQDWRVRSFSVSALAGITDNVETYISRANGCLNDSRSEVRVAAVTGIGAQVNAPDLAIPILKETLNSTDDVVSAASAYALVKFGTNGAPAFSSLTNIIANGRHRPAGAALFALAAVAPDRAVPIVSNTVVNGETSLSYSALFILSSAAPDLGVQLTLAQLRSPDPQRRLQALEVAPVFDINTPGIAEALKLACNDEDSDVRIIASNALKQLDPQAAANAGIK
jgi:HEAT repeat protein